MSEVDKQSAQRCANILEGLSPEHQAAIGRNLAMLIDIAMDTAEQIAPMLVKSQPG